MVFYFKKLLSTSEKSIKISLGICTKMKPPETIRGITVLDKQLFNKHIKVFYLTINKSRLGTILPIIKSCLMKLEKFKPVQHAEDSVEIYLNPDTVKGWCSFPPQIQNTLMDLSVTEADLNSKDFTVKYENYNAENVLKGILPLNKEGASSFTKIGHIVHVNLREHLLPYKTIIGEILYDKIPGCKSVVNKVNMIDNTYRNFSMEILKGENNMITTVKENCCSFKFDFSKVYWNSRLCTEHERIVNSIEKNAVLFDVFAGVGPFSIPVAKKGCIVYANDLNPESFHWLNFNKKANKISDAHLKSFNKDGREFIKTVIKENLPQHLAEGQKVFIVMNLPAMAVEFLDSFVGLINPEELPNFSYPPTLYIYCFAKGVDYVDIARKLVIDNFGCDIEDKITEIFPVRTVSSLKEMMRVKVRLDRDILVGSCKKRKLEDGFESKNKKISSPGQYSSLFHCFNSNGNYFQVTMVKKSKKKTDSVFKVAGAKSLKLKAKAKAVKSGLKQINIKNKNHVGLIDDTLNQLENEIRKTGTKQPPNETESKLPYKLPSIDSEKCKETDEQSNAAVDTLNEMHL